MLKLLIVVATVYLAASAIMYLMQRSMLYHPSTAGMTAHEANALSLTKWPDESGYRGYLSEIVDATRTIVIFHGNAGEAATRAYYPAALATTRSRIFLAEYPGYGDRPGSPSEDLFVQDARTTLALIAKQFPNEPLIVMGESMGAGVASAAVAPIAPPSNTSHADISLTDQLTIDGLVLITPWDSLTNLAQTLFWFIPARILVLDRYDSVKNLQAFHGPKAVVIASLDRIVPKKHALTLFDSIPPAKRKFELDKAGHNNWIDHVDDLWWSDLMTYLSTPNTTPSKALR